VAEAIDRGYRDAPVDVEKETPLDPGDLPASCPYTAEQILDPAALPE
jgi:hypothetical protein